MDEYDKAFALAMGGAQEKPAEDAYAAPFAEAMRQASTPSKPAAATAPKAKNKSASQEGQAFEQSGSFGSQLARGLFNAAQGPAFGFGDELMGAAGAVLSAPFTDKPLSQSYQENRDFLRGMQGSYEQDYPVTAPVTQIAATAPMMVSKLPGMALQKLAPALGRAVLPGATQATGLGTRAAISAGSGLLSGALQGAGSSNASTIGGVTNDTLRGAVLSAGLGGAAPVLGKVVNTVAQPILSRVSKSAAGDYAQQKVAEAFLRDAPQGINPINQAVARIGKLGNEARIVDAGGQSTRDLLDQVATQRGASTNLVERAIRDRQSTSGSRLVSAADRALGTQGREYGAALEALDATRKQAAAPYYQQISQANVTVDDDILALLNRAGDTRAEAQKLMRLQTGQNVDLSAVRKGESIPFSMLDTLKQSLYDAADTSKRQGANKMGSAYDSVRKDLVNKLDAVSPTDAAGNSVYKLARDAYAGPSQLMDASELGRTAMKADTFEVKSALKNLSQSEQEAFRIGALQALKEKTGTQSGRTSLMKMYMEPSTSSRLKDIFGNDYRKFAASVAAEQRLKGLEQVGRGSQTAKRLAGAGDLDMSPVTGAMQAFTGSPVQGATSIGKFLMSVQTPEPVRDKMGALLLSRDKNELRGLLSVIPELNQARMNRAANYGAGIGMNAGGLLGAAGL